MKNNDKSKMLSGETSSKKANSTDDDDFDTDVGNVRRHELSLMGTHNFMTDSYVHRSTQGSLLLNKIEHKIDHSRINISLRSRIKAIDGSTQKNMGVASNHRDQGGG